MSESPFFPIADKLREAGSHAERALLLLKLSDDALLGGCGDLRQACTDTSFAAGDHFVVWRVTALCRTRDAHGMLPDWVGQEVEQWRLVLSRIAAGGQV